MKKQYYNEIFKRKSFHLFRGIGNEKLSPSELDGIKSAYEGFEKLYPGIKTEIRIVPAAEAHFKHGAEYCILIYSEKKENYLMNAGFIGQQLDLYLVQNNIASLWCGLSKPDELTLDGLSYVIMIAIAKLPDDGKFRKDMFSAKRKPLSEIWSGDDLGIADIARFAPSACNSQPWLTENSGDELTVCRIKKPGRVGIMPPSAAFYFNRIDIGIYLCILEICMEQNGIDFERTLFPDTVDERKNKVAVYKINR